MGELDFNQFLRLRNQLENTAEKVAGEETLTPVVIPTMCKNLDEQLKLAHMLVDIVGRAKGKLCVTLLRYRC